MTILRPKAKFSGPKLIMHIGGPKCGSSSLQTFLTRNPHLETLEGSQVYYWKVIEQNNFLHFEPVKEMIVSRGLGYEYSGSLIQQLTNKCIHKIFEKFILDFDNNKNNIYVFSSEGWGAHFQLTSLARCTCIEKHFETSIYLNVRPQLSLVSSVYLQWILWSENPSLLGSFSFLAGNCDWEIQAQNSFQLGADEVFVRCAKDITTDFCATFGINSAKISNPLTRKVNKTSGLEVITLLLRNRELRMGPHDSDIDFFLESLLDEIDFSPTPIKLKIDNKLSNDIEEHFRINNAKLIKRMSSDHADFFESELISSKNSLHDGFETESLWTLGKNEEFLEKITVVLLSDIKRKIGGGKIFKTELSSRALDHSAVAERESIVSSTIWKLFTPYRKLIRFVRRI